MIQRTNHLIQVSSWKSTGSNQTRVGTILTVNGAVFRYSGTGVGQSSDRQVTIGPNGATIESSGSAPLKLTNSSNIGFSGNGARTITFDGTNTGNNTYAGILRNVTSSSSPTRLSIIKDGTGTWRFSSDSYTPATNEALGGTTVNNGTLIFDAGIKSTVTIKAGARFGGSGEVTGDRTHVYGNIFASAPVGDSADTVIAASIGKFTVSNLHFYAGGIFEFDLATDGSTGEAGVDGWDQIYANYALTMGANSTFADAPNGNNPFVFQLTTLTSPTTGEKGLLSAWDYASDHTWSSILDVRSVSNFVPSQLVVDTSEFHNDYQGSFSIVMRTVGSRRAFDLVYTYDPDATYVPAQGGAVPEPTTFALFGGLIVLAFGAMRSRRKTN